FYLILIVNDILFIFIFITAWIRTIIFVFFFIIIVIRIILFFFLFYSFGFNRNRFTLTSSIISNRCYGNCVGLTRCNIRYFETVLIDSLRLAAVHSNFESSRRTIVTPT